MDFKKSLKHCCKGVAKSRWVLETIGRLAFTYAWLVGKTGRFDVQGVSEFEQLVEENDGGIFVTWHGRALMLPFFWRNTRLMKALVSPHSDGRIIAKLLNLFDILTIDGSTDRKATKAALEIVKELNKGTVVALISDGPRGPRMRLNKSVIYFAQKTGKPVMGFAYSSKKALVMRNSWDNMLLPRLFARGKVAATKPLFVPKNATEEELEQLRCQFEDELNQITMRLDKECGLAPIVPGEDKKKKRPVWGVDIGV